MEKTGMTRRIDELGRLVIPKEIRKNLKIKDNDQVEISVIGDKIVLNKFENIHEDQIITILINNLKKSINKNILFTSRDVIIDKALLNKNILIDKKLDEDLINLIEDRKDIVNFNYHNLIYCIYPLIINGDLYGSLIAYNSDIFKDNDLKMIKFSLMFLENYLE